ncbi:MAG: 50S ribosomal protein L11 methyltransferase [bacterium]|nr:50S ribosomal protein L11 methyltransferase [bacterium]
MNGPAASTGPIRWTEVRVAVPLGWQELVADALALGACTSVVFGRTSIGTEPAPEGTDYVRTFIADHEDTNELRATIRARLDGLADSTGADELRGLALRFQSLPPEDYASSWRRSWRPFRLGRLAIVPPWREYEPRPNELLLLLEPGGAFGSGRHPTTRACLRIVQERVRPGARVLDAGSGSGILSVAAALFGASEVLGFDVDANGARYGTALARDNGVADACSFRTGDFGVLSQADTEYHGVLANIYSDVIVAHAGDLRARVRDGAWFAFSGCPTHHLETTRAAIDGAGFRIDQEHTRGRWTTFEGEARP